MNDSIWTKSVKLPRFNKLEGDKKTDVLIIGGGMCGILCAYFLDKAGVDYILVEGGRIASGVTQNTTAKITSQHGLLYTDIKKRRGEEYAKMYLSANEKAIERYEELSRTIPCDFERKSAYTYSQTRRDKIEEEVRTVKELGYEAEFTEATELPFSVSAIKFDNQAHFNPLKFITGLSQNLNIYEDTFVREMIGNIAVADKGRIYADKVIVATHFPFINKHGFYFLKLYQHRSYVTAYENVPKLEGMYVDEADLGMSFVCYKDKLLIGGGGHRTGKKGGAWREIDGFKNRYYPDAKKVCSWATQDCMSLDGVPYIGVYSKGTENFYTATGFNKWGMTSSMVAGELLADMILEKKNEFSELFSPSRSMLTTQLVINGAEAAVNLLTPSKKRCPHLGCALKWNRAEHTWDCPCHGSRFSEEGELLNNPATGDIKPKKLK